MQRVKLLMAIMFITMFVACKKGHVENPNPVVPQDNCNGIDSRFATKVFPIIQTSCATNIGCHANGSNNGPGALLNYGQINAASAAIKTAVSSGVMPKNSTLGALEKNTITCWVSSGAPNN